MSDELDFLFGNESTEEQEPKKTTPSQEYHVLIVDDENDIHEVTVMALTSFEFDDSKLKFHHAYSGAEAKELLSSGVEFAVVLLDVVMESNDAGLQVAHWIRNDLDNHTTRIVLRTGQPGDLPEDDLMSEYDIHDYKNKTELTSLKLKTLMRSCLRSYRDIKTIERGYSQLKTIVNWSDKLFKKQTPEEFYASVIDAINELLIQNHHGSMVILNSFQAIDHEIIYGTGKYSDYKGQKDRSFISKFIEDVCNGFRVIDNDLLCIVQKGELELVLYIEGLDFTDNLDGALIENFLNHVAVGYVNCLNLGIKA